MLIKISDILASLSVERIRSLFNSGITYKVSSECDVPGINFHLVKRRNFMVSH